MAKSHRILYLVYGGFELIDLSGPANVFSAANHFLGRQVYENLVLSPKGGVVESDAGICVSTRPTSDIRISPRDTLLVMGANEAPLRKAFRDEALLAWLRRSWPSAGRYGSICSGALLLAHAGGLDRRSATTHWRARESLARNYPQIETDEDALYINDGEAWTSAGGTSGIDMALALVQHDHGSALMHRVAKHLVVYSHRPGTQSQFSALLDAQSRSDAAFSDLIAWMKDNLACGLTVGKLAQRATMSERTFHRKFSQAVGTTPARFLDELRLDHARSLLETHQPVKRVAAASGFASEGGFRAAFEAKYGVTPSLYRTFHSGGSDASN